MLLWSPWQFVSVWQELQWGSTSSVEARCCNQRRQGFCSRQEQVSVASIVAALLPDCSSSSGRISCVQQCLYLVGFECISPQEACRGWVCQPFFLVPAAAFLARGCARTCVVHKQCSVVRLGCFGSVRAQVMPARRSTAHLAVCLACRLGGALCIRRPTCCLGRLWLCRDFSFIPPCQQCNSRVAVEAEEVRN